MPPVEGYLVQMPFNIRLSIQGAGRALSHSNLMSQLHLSSGLLRPYCFTWLLLALVLSFSSPAKAETTFYAFVQENHKWKPDLKGWTNTARLLETILCPAQSKILIDREPDEFHSLLSIPRKSGEYRVVYFATHMHSDGRLFFSNKEQLQPDELLRRIDRLGEIVAPDLIIIDCCFAERFKNQPLWNETFRSAHLYTCDSNQVTWEFEIDTKRPLYLKKYYPDVFALGSQLMGRSSNGKLSYFGLQLLFNYNRMGRENVEVNPRDLLRKTAVSPYSDERLIQTRRMSRLVWAP